MMKVAETTQESLISNKGSKKLKPKKTDRVARGIATNDLVFSAYQDTNDNIFPHVAALYIPKGSRVADVTFGRGVFWRNIPEGDYELFASDLKAEPPEGCRPLTDSRKLPYEDSFFDALVFDPPYMHTPGHTAHDGHQNFEKYYANNVAPNQDVIDEILKDNEGVLPKYHEAVLDLYFRSAREAWRVLKPNGIYIVKCQDEVCANKQRLTHVEITNELVDLGFEVEDLFVVMRNGKPGVSRLLKQAHARKNHSYFMVYRKPKKSKKDA